jgi:hypothetical protein
MARAVKTNPLLPQAILMKGQDVSRQKTVRSRARNHRIGHQASPSRGQCVEQPCGHPCDPQSAMQKPENHRREEQRKSSHRSKGDEFKMRSDHSAQQESTKGEFLGNWNREHRT